MEEFSEVNGELYNSKGYKICGHLNQHGKPCQRIGKCPFHDESRQGYENVKIIYPSSIKISRKKKVGRGSSKPYKKGWTKEEHFRFLTGLRVHGRGSWKEISEIVRTRNATQTQSHAQKYFNRQKQSEKTKKSIHDLTLEQLEGWTTQQLIEQASGKVIHSLNPFVKTPNPVVDMSNFAGFFQRSLDRDGKETNFIENRYYYPMRPQYVPNHQHYNVVREEKKDRVFSSSSSSSSFLSAQPPPQGNISPFLPPKKEEIKIEEDFLPNREINHNFSQEYPFNLVEGADVFFSHENMSILPPPYVSFPNTPQSEDDNNDEPSSSSFYEQKNHILGKRKRIFEPSDFEPLRKKGKGN